MDQWIVVFLHSTSVEQWNTWFVIISFYSLKKKSTRKLMEWNTGVPWQNLCQVTAKTINLSTDFCKTGNFPPKQRDLWKIFLYRNRVSSKICPEKRYVREWCWLFHHRYQKESNGGIQKSRLMVSVFYTSPRLTSLPKVKNSAVDDKQCKTAVNMSP